MKTLNAGWSRALAETIKTISSAFQNVSARTTLSRSSDSILFYDAASKTVRKITIDNIPDRDAVRRVSLDYTATSTDQVILVDASAAAVTITLPRAATVPGQCLKIKKVDGTANAVTVDAYADERIDGQATMQILFQYDCMNLVAITQWYIV